MKFAKSILFTSILCLYQLTLTIQNNENKLTQADLDFIATLKNKDCEYLVKKFITEKDQFNNPILADIMWQCRKDDQKKYNIIKTLILNYNANPNTSNKFCSPLIAAIRDQHINIIHLLLKHKADINCFNIFKKTPFILNNSPLTSAISIGNMDIVKILLESGANPNKMYGDSPLSTAIEKNNIDCIHLLLKYGAIIQHYDSARAIFNMEILELLVNKGAPIKGKYCNSGALINIAFFDDMLEATTTLILASSNGQFKAVQFLLEKGVELDIQDIDGDTALIKACQFGNTEIVRLLLQYKANSSIKNNNNQTAKDVAKEKGHTEIVKLLS